MEFLTQPKPMIMEGDLGENWRKFKSNFNIYSKASGCTLKTQDIQAAILLHCVGQEAREIFESFDMTEEEKNKPGEIITKFDAYFLPQTNKSIERHRFNTRVQLKGESFEAYVADLRKIGQNCDFGNLRDELIKDRIVCGIRDPRVKNRLLREANLSFNKAVEICKAAEESENLVQNLNEQAKELHLGAIRKDLPRYNTRVAETTDPHMWSGSASNNRGSASNKNRQAAARPNMRRSDSDRRSKGWVQTRKATFQRMECGRCGFNHDARNICPARDKKCSKCKKYNHFSRKCKSHVVNMLETNEDTSNEPREQCNYTLGTMYINNLDPHSDSDWYEKIKIKDCNQCVEFRLDCGADCNVIPLAIFQNMKLPNVKLRRVENEVFNYEGSKLNVIGSCSLDVMCKNQANPKRMTFIIIKVGPNAKPVLGLKTISELNLLVRPEQSVCSINSENKIISENKDLFAGVGKIKTQPCKFLLKLNYEPIIATCRKVPFQLIEPLQKELLRMKKDEIITEIEEATEFVNPIVLVKKPNGTIRICLDPKRLNEVILRERYELPTFEELTHNLSGSQYFSILDASKGFWQIPLSEESSKFTTFVTPFGRYRFLRLPYGLSNSPEIFHRIFSNIFKNIKGVKIYIDDIIIFAKDKKDHDNIVQQVLTRAREMGVKFNKEKCHFGLKEIKYVGHIISKDGIKIDNDKVEAIKQIKTPQNSKELSRFLGMVTYVSKFIPNLAALTANLRKLIKKDTVWYWSTQHDTDFNHLKELLSSRPVLQFYDEEKEIRLSVDSSKDGMGAVIFQNGGPVAYASKALTETQQRYAQIEKELLAIVFGCHRFKQYIYGKKVVVETDHKPLESIFKKQLDKTPLRLQRLLINSQNFDIEVKYVPGAKLYVADALSRSSYVDLNFNIIENETEAHVNLIQYASISPKQFNNLQNQTSNDEELILLTNIVKEGWPIEKSKVPNIIKPYWKHRDEIVELDNVLVKGEQFIIPKSMRKEMIGRIHYSHLGIEKTINKAKEHIFWPFMVKEITDVIKNCATCLKYHNSQQNETLINKELPERPWQIIAADFFSLDSTEYLLIVDVYSKFPELIKFKTTTSDYVINHFKSIFARYGKPDILYSDNGPQFVNEKFQNFLENWEVIHRTSSPRFPQSNGFIERQVQTIKKTVKKALYDNKDVYLTMLEYRNTPLGNNLPSPAQLLFGRRLKGHVPISKKMLVPEYNFPNYDKILKIKQNMQKSYFDQHAKNLPDNLKQNDLVVVQNKNKEWEPGRIVEKNFFRPRSYNVQLDNTQNVIGRNRKFIKKIGENNFKLESDVFDEIMDDKLNTSVDKSVENADKNQYSDNNQYSGNNIKTTTAVTPHVNQKKGERGVVTRSGRQIKQPAYLRDFIC